MLLYLLQYKDYFIFAIFVFIAIYRNKLNKVTIKKLKKNCNNI